MTMDFSGQRMNFLQVGRGGITYGVLLTAIAGWFVLLGLWYGIGALRLVLLHHRIAELRTDVVGLNAKKERALMAAQGPQAGDINPTAKKELGAMFSQAPRWSAVLTDFAPLVPRSVMLDHVAITRKVPPTGMYDVTITGTARNEQPVAHFVLNLEGTALFRDIVLGGTKRSTNDRGELTFDIVGHVHPPGVTP